MQQSLQMILFHFDLYFINKQVDINLLVKLKLV